MTPKEAFQQALWRCMVGSNIRHGPHGRPGELIQRMSPEAREALKDLRAEHIQDRIDDGMWIPRADA